MERIVAVADRVENLSLGGNAESASPVGRKDKKDKKEKPKKADKKGAAADNVPLEMTPAPAYISHRIQLFEKLKAEYDKEVASKPREDITITLPDGATKVGKSWETTPMNIACDISKGLADSVVIAKVDGELWDLGRPLEKSCRLELLKFEDKQGQQVFWHSSAHVLGEAAERRFGCHLCLGPPTDDGFFYEMGMENDGVVTQADYKPLETIALKAIKEKQPFERLVVSKENLLKMFEYNKYKQHLIQTKIEDGTSTTVYRCGPLIDLCIGPHVPHTGRIKAFQVKKNSSCYFLGDSANETLQRIYGISFPDKKQLEEYNKRLEEAAKRDHRKIGKEQELFFFHELSPGSCFFLPHGARIYNTLVEFLREEYWKRDYQEVITPNMYNSKLWEISGHWQNYRDGMFTFEVEKDQYGLKPMNCPGHCLMFAHRERSYRELPWRVADFGVVHRNEFSGALTGLTRVRRFQQDDTHIFCTQDQVASEIQGLFDFLKTTYGIFGFTFKLKLSTRPDKYVGEIETWNHAENQLKAALEEFTAAGGSQWELNPGDGAFYGPKIDITICDALGRDHQCATIQLDFQLPQRFDLQYNTGESAAKLAEGDESVTAYARPVMIHRAILGSVERFLAILTEHFAGKWPFWISPRQVLIIPVMMAANDYASEVHKLLRAKGLHCDVDLGPNTMPKKIRTGQIQGYNFIFVVGAEERENRAVNIRNRDDKATQAKGDLMPLDEAIDKLVALKTSRNVVNAL